MPVVFKIGDIVTLKSGGPSMTVSSVRNATDVDVVWFSGEDDRTVCTHFFHHETLIPQSLLQALYARHIEDVERTFDTDTAKKFVDILANDPTAR